MFYGRISMMCAYNPPPPPALVVCAVWGVSHTVRPGPRVRMSQVAAESIGSCRTVFAFNLQQLQVERYIRFLDGAVNVSKALVAGLSYGFSQFVIFAAFALSFWYGGTLVHAGEIDGGAMLRCAMSVLMGAMGVGEVFSMAGDTAEASVAAERVLAMIDRAPPIDSQGDSGVAFKEIAGSGSFKDVAFSYPSRPDVKILKGLNLDFTGGQRVALLGSTGCGKSTIISLLMRFYDPLSGEVRRGWGQRQREDALATSALQNDGCSSVRRG